MIQHRKLLIAIALGALPTVAVAQQPVRDVSPFRHGNLAAAQQLVEQAFNRITAAQQANEFDLGGHAGRAKELLRQANAQLKMAAMTANRRRW